MNSDFHIRVLVIQHSLFQVVADCLPVVSGWVWMSVRLGDALARGVGYQVVKTSLPVAPISRARQNDLTATRSESHVKYTFQLTHRIERVTRGRIVVPEVKHVSHIRRRDTGSSLGLMCHLYSPSPRYVSPVSSSRQPQLSGIMYI